MDNWYNKAMTAQKTNPQVAELMEAYKAAQTQEDKDVVKNAVIELLSADAPASVSDAPVASKDPKVIETPALKITAEVITVLSDLTEKLHTVELELPRPESWNLHSIRSFFRRRILPFYFRENNIVYRAITKVLTDESMIQETMCAFPYKNKPIEEWTQKDFQMAAIEYGLYSFPLPNTKSLGELRAWLREHQNTDELTTLPSESDI